MVRANANQVLERAKERCKVSNWNEFHCEVKRETEKALLVEIRGEEFWVPKSQVDDTYPEVGDVGTIGLTDWIAAAKNLI